MQPCDAWAIALERDRRHDLSPEEAAALAAHLATCAACASARAEAELLDAALAVGPPAPDGWSALERRLRRAQGAYRRDVRFGAAMMCLFLLAFWAVRGLAAGRFLDAFGIGLLVGGAFDLVVLAGHQLWLSARERRMGAGEDLFEALRRRYRRRLFVLRFVSPFLPLGALLLLAVRRHLGAGHGWIVVLACGLGFAVVAAWARGRLLPRLVRELAELEGKA